MLSPDDSQFGPKLPGKFDFTLQFEHIMFGIVPSIVAILSIPYYIKVVRNGTRLVRPGALLWAKLAVGSALFGIYAASLVLWQRSPALRSSGDGASVALAAAGTSFVASASILFILYAAHIYSLQPSAFLSLFLALTALLDIASTRSFFLRDGLGKIGALHASIVGLKIILVIFEEISKRRLICDENLRATVAKETVAGFWNRAVFGWLNSLMISGYKNDLGEEDLPSFNETLDSLRLYDQFLPRWKQANKASSYSLLKALSLTIYWQAIKIILPRLIFVALTFSQPFLLFRVVHAVAYGADEDIAHGLMGATALIFGGKAFSRALYEHMSYQMLTSIRGIHVIAIFDKLQKLSMEELAKSSAVTLMTTDTTGVGQMVSLIDEVWSSLLQLGLGIWSLSLFTGPACFLMFIPGIFTFVASHFLGQAMGKARAAWNQEMESRVAATSTVLAQIKGIKSLGLSEEVFNYLQEMRRQEVATSIPERRTRIWLFAFAAMSYTLSPLFVLTGTIFWTRASDTLDVAEILTILSIVCVASSPFTTLLSSFLQWAAGLASLRRIEAFLCLEEMEDRRHFPEAHSTLATSFPCEKYTPPSQERPLSSRLAPLAIKFDLVTIKSDIVGPILKEVTFQVPWGALAIFWGPISCGKSTLLKTLLGETKPTVGTVTIGTKFFSYCSQESWLQNRTIRGNIIGVLDYVEEWYREVVVCCGLDLDIAALAGGDQVMTGTGGCNLSGGQKQRVALARSVYPQPDIIVVDDVLSALDPQTARFVFDKVFGSNGLVRRWNCTVVMTTNQLQFLDGADLNFQMHKGGVVEQQATGAQVPGVPRGDNLLVAAAEDEERIRTRKAELPSVKPLDEATEAQKADQKRKGGDWSLYSYYFAPAGTIFVICWLVFTGVCAAVEQMPAIFLKTWYSNDASNRYYFIGFVAFCFLCIVFNSICGAVFFYFILPKTSRELHQKLATVVMSATFQFLTQTDSGVILNKFSQDLFLTSQYLPITFMQFIFAFYSVIVEISVIAAGSPYTAPIIIFVLAILGGIQFFYLRTSRRLRLLELEATSAIFTQVTEVSAGIQHVRSFRWQPQFLEQMLRILDRSQKPFYLLFCCQRWLNVVLDFTAGAAALILVSVSLSLPHTTSAGAVGLAILNLIGLNETTSFFIYSWTNLETGLGAVSRIRTFCRETPCEEGSSTEKQIPNWPSRGRLEFKAVSACYELKDGTSQKALDGVSMTIEPGEKVGICGRTGSGKSSLFLALLRLLDYSGIIAIDGQDITAARREWLRSHITTLTQDGVLLKGSLRLNLYPFPGPKPEDDLIVSVLESIGLWEHFQRHGELDSDITAVSLSTSQKQLLFLARGILHQKTMGTKIVIMDEATSSMDYGTNETLQTLLEENLKTCTVLQIGHREDSFRAANVLIRLEGGKLTKL